MRSLRLARPVLRDFVRYNPASKVPISYVLEAWDRLRPSQAPDALGVSLNRLALAARLRAGLGSISAIEVKLQERMARWSAEDFDWHRFYPESAPAALNKSIILKRPQGRGEKGVLFIAFEYNWLRLVRHGDVAKLSADYDIILSPSFSPPQDLALLIAAKMWPETVFTILSNFADAELIQRLASKFCTIPLLASSFVDEKTVTPTGAPKTFDIAVPASFLPFKRHFALFRALRRMDPGIRVLLLGRGFDGHTRENLEDQARLYGVLDRLTIKEGAPRNSWMPMLRELMTAKVALILSMEEGSNVSTTEAMFGDVPVGLVEGARVGSIAFINEQTGRILRPHRLAEDLTEFIGEYRKYRPRAWALEHGLSCRESSRVLNECVKENSLKAGRPWTVDLVPMTWCPEPSYLNPADRHGMRDEYSRFGAAYGVRLEAGYPAEAPAVAAQQP